MSMKNVSTTLCSNVEPMLDILKWSDLGNSTINGTNQERDIKELCHTSIKSIHQIVPVMLNQEKAMHACKILNAEMAYPNASYQFKEFQSKYLMNPK